MDCEGTFIYYVKTLIEICSKMKYCNTPLNNAIVLRQSGLWAPINCLYFWCDKIFVHSTFKTVMPRWYETQNSNALDINIKLLGSYSDTSAQNRKCHWAECCCICLFLSHIVFNFWFQKGARNTQHLSVSTFFVESESGKISTQYDFQPSVGIHLIKYGPSWIRIERTREQRMMEPWETIQVLFLMYYFNIWLFHKNRVWIENCELFFGITKYNSFHLLQMTSVGKNRHIFASILDEARALAMETHSGKTIMYTVVGADWRPFGHPRQRRPLNSVVLDEGVGEKLVQDVKEFIQVYTKIL